MSDADDLPPVKATPQVPRWRGILQRIGAGLVLLALSPLIIGLAPIWVPLNWYQDQKWRKNMARPRGCLTYQMTAEQLAYFEASLPANGRQMAREYTTIDTTGRRFRMSN